MDDALLRDLLTDVPWAPWGVTRGADGTLVVDLVTPAGAALMGLAADALGADLTPAFAHVPPADVAAIFAELERSAADLSPFHAEFRVAPPGGPVGWREARAVPAARPGGGIRWRGITLDVTGRKAAEARAREGHDLLRQLLAQAPLAIAMLDREFRYLAWSERWRADYGRGLADLAGVGHHELWPELPERLRAAHRAGLDGLTITARDDPWTDDVGVTHWNDWVVHPWRTATGAIGGIVISIEDVTDRARTRDALAASERQVRTLLEAVPVGIWVNHHGTLSIVNAEACRLLGAPDAAALVGRPVWDVLPPDTHDAVRERVAAVRAGDEVAAYRTRVVGLDGVERPVEVTARSMPGDDRDVLVLVRDLGDQLRAEAAARESEARLDGIIRSVMDAIVTVDTSHTIVLANPAAEQMFGYGPGELLGRPLDELVPATRRPAHRAAMAAFADRPAAHQTMGGAGAMLEGLHRSGEVFPIETSVSKATIGGRSYYTAVHRDLAPRLRTEGALARERERFRQLAEAIREVFWLKDVATNQILYVSPAYETVWGRSAEHLYVAPEAWRDAIHPDDRATVAAALPGQALGRYDLEYRIVRPDGAVRWVHDRSFPVVDGEGRVVRVAGVAEDVTQRRLLEEQVRSTQRLESMGRLAGGVAHDFNNLLTIILSSAEFVREGVGPADEAVDEILDAARRGATLTRQLLAFTRQEVVEPRLLRLASVVTDAERLLRRLIGEDIVIRTAIDAGSGAVRVDPGQWSQVVLNLAVNARDAMPDGGTLRIATYPVTVDAAHGAAHPAVGPGRWEVLEVSDTGCGMSAEVQQRMFEPFFTTKARGQGTGLGLAVVYGVVQQAGGQIEVQSVEGAGTTFRIYLPRVDVAASHAPATGRSGDAGGGSERVLLVEDEIAVRRVAAHILRSRGYHVTVADDGAAALRAVEAMERPPQVLVTDIVMPGMDGGRLAEALRARVPGLKVLFTSGYIDETITRRGVTGAGTSFLQKPYSPVSLTARIRELLDGG